MFARSFLVTKKHQLYLLESGCIYLGLLSASSDDSDVMYINNLRGISVVFGSEMSHDSHGFIRVVQDLFHQLDDHPRESV